MSGMSFYLAAVADALPAQNRSIGFGMVLAFASLGFILGPLLGAFMPNMDVAFSATIGVLLLGILYAVLVLEDTLPPQTTEEEEDDIDLNSVEAPAEMEGPNTITHKKRKPSAWKEVFESVTMISILNRTPLFRRLSLLIVCSSMCSGGLQEFLFQYLQMVLDFQTQDQAMLLVGHPDLSKKKANPLLPRVYLVPRVVCILKLLTPLLQTRLLLLLLYTPAATNPEVYAEHYAARAAACRRYHIGSLQKLLCPFWSPFTTRGSIRGWVFCTPPSPGCRFVYILFVLFLSFP
jgi:MFS family permease